MPNPNIGVALTLSEKLEIPVGLALRILKKHSPEELRPVVEWWKSRQVGSWKKIDAPPIALIYWKLKKLYPEKYSK